MRGEGVTAAVEQRFSKIGTTFAENDGVGTRSSGAPPVGSTGRFEVGTA